MAEIACLGWGSLVWRREKLLVEEPWHDDGPHICVEFLRQSGGGRMTLVLDASAAPIPSLWAMMNTHNVGQAVASLAERETGHATWTRNIGSWTAGSASPPLIPDLREWATKRNLDAVIWTNLGSRFGDEDRLPARMR